MERKSSCEDPLETLIPRRFQGTFTRHVEGGFALYYLTLLLSLFAGLLFALTLFFGEWSDLAKITLLFAASLCIFNTLRPANTHSITIFIEPEFIEVRELNFRVRASDIDISSMEIHEALLPRPVKSLQFRTRRPGFFLRWAQVHWLGRSMGITLEVPK